MKKSNSYPSTEVYLMTSKEALLNLVDSLPDGDVSICLRTAPTACDGFFVHRIIRTQFQGSEYRYLGTAYPVKSQVYEKPVPNVVGHTRLV